MEILFICKKRAINDYHNITVNEFFNNNNYMKLLVGPYFGLEPTKVTLSSYYKFMYSVYNDWNVMWRSPPRYMNEISKYPTQDSLFSKLSRDPGPNKKKHGTSPPLNAGALVQVFFLLNPGPGPGPLGYFENN